MKTNLKTTSKVKMKLLLWMTLLCFAFSAIPAYAAGDSMEVIFENVTASDTTTLSGEAKIKVSVRGVQGSVSIAQMAMSFSGDLKYKSIAFLQGKNDPANGFVNVSPNAAAVNMDKKINASIIAAKDPLIFGEKTDLFVLTFSGEPGESVTLSLSDLDATYCENGTDVHPTQTAEITAAASSKENEGKNAVVNLVMDSVKDFTAADDSGYANSRLELTITGETTGTTLYTVLNNTPISKGGHRDATVTIPTFQVTNLVVAGETYTVELTGLGYIGFKQTGVNFDNPINITNKQFIPGDVNGDGKVDLADKKLVQQAMEDSELADDLNGATDFNRDGKTDKYDLAVFDGVVEEENGVPAAMQAPSVTGGDKRVTVGWTKPDEGNSPITGYVIRYGTSANQMNSIKDVDDASASSEIITGLEASTTYYVSIAAKNALGTGVFSPAASTKTDGNGGGNTGGSTGGGFGGGGGIGGGGTTPSDNAGSSTVQTPGETFVDLGNYDWAKDAIYNLKNKGIINGISETEYSPASNIKRGDYILILTRMLGINNAFEDNFADVPADSYYYNAIGMAKAAGIAKGNGENFMPEDSITRQDLITLAYRAFLEKGLIAETDDLAVLDQFADKASISDYAQTAMASMVTAGIIQGSDGGVNPLGNATRAEVAVMCNRLVNLMQ